jgi:hypothetical protein
MSRPAPSAPRVERRRRRRGPLTRLLTAPLPVAALDGPARQGRAVMSRALRLALVLLPLMGLAAATWQLWARRIPVATPRHRAEALCFALAQPPRFAPSMRVVPEAAMVRGRFAASTPAPLALRRAMGFGDDRVLWERQRRIGDYEVATLWLRLPAEAGVGSHGLVVGWMEGADLAVCSFRFAGDEEVLGAEQRLWGNRLLARLLIADNFRAASLPSVRLRLRPGDPLPAFGPGVRAPRA